MDRSNPPVSDEWVFRILTATASGLVAYFTAYSTTNSRLATLEAHVETLNQLAQESRNDIKELLRSQR